MISKLKQIICALRGHSAVTVEFFERDAMDAIERGSMVTCRRCGKVREYVETVEVKWK